MDYLSRCRGLILASLVLVGCDADGDTTALEPVEERHVVIAECGVELACEPMRLVLDYHPSEAYTCASERWASGGTGRLSIVHETDGDAYVTREDALVLLPDGQILRQVRAHDIGAQDNAEDDRWLAWGEHELCENINDTFAPEANFLCQAVPDWTCDDVLATVSE